MSMHKNVVETIRRLIPIRSQAQSNKLKPIVVQHNNLGALIVDKGPGRGSNRFWIRIGRVKPSFGDGFTEVKTGFHPMDVFALPGLAIQIAKRLASQTIVAAIQPDDVHLRREVRQDLMKFVKSYDDAKWNGTFPQHLTWLARRQCRCFFDANEKGFEVVLPQRVEKEVSIDSMRESKQRKLHASIDKALGLRD